MRDDNMQQKQEQDEQEQFEEAHVKQLNAMSDEEFYKWIGDIEMNCQQAKQ